MKQELTPTQLVLPPFDNIPLNHTVNEQIITELNTSEHEETPYYDPRQMSLFPDLDLY